jgi:DNA-binding winged helix-turn-helix (wHTH) protein
LGEKVSKDEKNNVIYLWNVGFIRKEGLRLRIFNPLFSYFAKERVSEEAKDSGIEFSKKELLFFEYLKININSICEREKIVDEVWPEASDLGISDWAIDKLAARVRTKLKLQKNNYEIQTIKTRGFKLTEA